LPTLILSLCPKHTKAICFTVDKKLRHWKTAKAMESKKLLNMLSIISEKLTENEVPFCLIGAMALGVFGFPRYTSDIDFLADQADWDKISSIMRALGYTSFQKTETFVQFDSELGVYGKVDFMFVHTHEGMDVIKRSIIVDDIFSPKTPVVQPTDYVILKLMAIANNPNRGIRDEADIASFFDMYKKDLLLKEFDSLDLERIILLADRFGLQPLIEKYITMLNAKDEGTFNL